MKHNESTLQQSCLKWFKLQYPKHVIFAIPNGGKRSDVEAKIMKGEGVLAGVADLFLMCPNERWFGLFIEMKTAKGVQSDVQAWFEGMAIEYGYKYVIVRNIDEFISEVRNYLK